MSQFIGKGEILTEKFLRIVYPDATIIPQFPITRLKKLAYQMGASLNFSEEILKHKFDFLVLRSISLMVEVNYKHKEKAAKKWRIIFAPFLEELNIIPVTINDWDCKRLFKPKTKLIHYAEAMEDIINALETSGAKI